MAFVNAAEGQVDIDRIFVSGAYATDKARREDDIWLLVISPSFDGRSIPERVDTLAKIGMGIDKFVQSWGFTPGELSRTRKSEGGVPFLGMMLNQSREIYTNPAASQSQEDEDD